MRLGVVLLSTLLLLLVAAAAPRDDASTFFRSGRIPSITIELTPESIENLRANPRAYAPCTVRDGDKVVSAKAGVKLKGAAGSFQAFDDRPALTINIDKFGEAPAYNGLRKFHLNNSVQDPSLLSEWTCSEIIRAAGQPATRVGHARLRLGDRDMGVYVLKEGFDEEFLRRNFRTTAGNLYDGGFCQDLDAPLERDEGTGAETRSDLQAIVEACRDPDMKARWKRLEQLVDIDDFIRFMALEAMVGHWDGYSFNSNNYRVFFEPTKKVVFLAHGMDQCFGDPNASVLDSPRAMLAASVMKNPEWRKQYRREITRLLPQFEATKLEKKLEPVEARIQKALREISPEAAAEQLAHAKGFLERVRGRAMALLAQSSAPEPKPLVFRKGQPVLVRDWRPMSEVDDAVLEEIDLGGAKWLRAAGGPGGRCIAGWRRSVLLSKGKYTFEAFVRAEGIEPLEEEGAPGVGGGIRTWDATRTADGVSSGERKVSFDFEVREEIADVELVIELRAKRGSIAFRMDSLRLTRE